jgi:phasin
LESGVHPYGYGPRGKEIIPLAVRWDWVGRLPTAAVCARRSSIQYGADAAGNCANLPVDIGEATMTEPKLEVPAELRELAEKTIDQAEKAFGMFFDAAGKSMTSMPGAGTEISRQALTFTEQNMKAAFEHARKLVHATDLQEAMRIQSEFLRSQFTNAGEHMRQITGGVISAAKDSTKGKF